MPKVRAKTIWVDRWEKTPARTAQDKIKRRTPAGSSLAGVLLFCTNLTQPTTALDVTIQAQVLELMRKLKAKYQTSMIMITHDLGIVAEICDYVAVMYAGEIVEYGNREQLFHRPSHPYTKGLFACIPNLMEEETTLIPIEGMTPDPTNLPTGCRFHPRCPYATEECSKTNPASKEIENGHHVKCLHI